MKVRNHKDFACFNYESEPSTGFQLGDILYRDDYEEEVGVVLQTFSDGDVRTDQWGVSSESEHQLADRVDIQRIRPDLIPHIEDAIYVHLQPMLPNPTHKDKYYFAESMLEARFIFEMLCHSKEYDFTDENEAGGIGHDFRIHVVI